MSGKLPGIYNFFPFGPWKRCKRLFIELEEEKKKLEQAVKEKEELKTKFRETESFLSRYGGYSRLQDAFLKLDRLGPIDDFLAIKDEFGGAHKIKSSLDSLKSFEENKIRLSTAESRLRAAELENLKLVEEKGALTNKNNDLLDDLEYYMGLNKSWEDLHDGKNYEIVLKEKELRETEQRKIYGLVSSPHESGKALEQLLSSILRRAFVARDDVKWTQQKTQDKGRTDFTVDFYREGSISMKMVIECKNVELDNKNKNKIPKKYWQQLVDYARSGQYQVAVLLTTIKYEGYESGIRFIHDWSEIEIEKFSGENIHLFVATPGSIEYLLWFLQVMHRIYRPVNSLDINDLSEKYDIDAVREAITFVCNFYRTMKDQIELIEKKAQFISTHAKAMLKHTTKTKEIMVSYENKIITAEERLFPLKPSPGEETEVEALEEEEE